MRPIAMTTSLVVCALYFITWEDKSIMILHTVYLLQWCGAAKEMTKSVFLKRIAPELLGFSVGAARDRIPYGERHPSNKMRSERTVLMITIETGVRR